MIAGGEWERTESWRCNGGDVGDLDIQVDIGTAYWGTAGSVEKRQNCARRCLETSNCVR